MAENKFEFDSEFKDRILTMSDYCGEGSLYIHGEGDQIVLIARPTKNPGGTIIKSTYTLLKIGAGCAIDCTVNLKRFGMILREYTQGEITVTENQLKIGKGKSSRSSVTMAVEQGGIEWPEFAVTKRTPMDGKLLSCLSEVNYASDPDGHTGEECSKYIKINVEERICSIMAINGTNACLARFNVDTDEAYEINIPSSVISRLMRIKSKKASIAQQNTHGLVELDKYEISFCTYQVPAGLMTVFDKPPIIAFRTEKAALMPFFNKVKIFDTGKSKVDLDFDTKAKLLKLSFKGTLGNISEQIPIEAAGAVKDVGITYSYEVAIRCLNALKGDRVQFDLTKEDEPTIFRVASDGVAYTHVLLPVRRTTETVKLETVKATENLAEAA